jgi:hypothetical protein
VTTLWTLLPWLAVAAVALGFGHLGLQVYRSAQKRGRDDAELERRRAIDTEREKADVVELQVARAGNPVAELRRAGFTRDR